MTAPVCVRQRIRQLDRQGLSHREISRKLGVSRTTVVKYANHGDYSPKPLGSGHAGRSLVDAGYSAVVDGWPAADLRMPVKQRHTATRVYERLVAECGFTGSYSSVQRWVKRWRREHRMESDGFAELEWAPGSMQVDFGQARLFSLFCAHYGFEPRFCNPYSGHGKGSVENAVGFVRRNLMVPMPSAESFQTLTRVWLDECERIAGSDHWRGSGAIRRKPRWIRRACSRSSRESPAYGAKARSGTISPKPCEPCSTAWTHARAPICSTTSEPLPPTAGSPPRSKWWKPSSTRDGPSTARRSAHAPNASSRVREPKAGRI